MLSYLAKLDFFLDSFSISLSIKKHVPITKSVMNDPVTSAHAAYPVRLILIWGSDNGKLPLGAEVQANRTEPDADAARLFM